MATEWKTVPIRELYDGLYDGPHATPKPSDSGPIFLGIKNVTDDGHLDLSEIRHIAEADYAFWTRRVEPRENDLVFTYEATLNRYALIPPEFRGCLGRRMALIRPNPKIVDVRCLMYYFFTSEWRTVIQRNKLSGSTVDRIPLTTFPEFPVRLPPLPIQRRIADILSTYDELIKNNQRRIKILEAMARALYREWFVHFRFPGHESVPLITSALGNIPADWGAGTFGELGALRKDAYIESKHADLPLLDMARMPSRSIASSELGNPTELQTSRIVFQGGDTLFGAIRCYLHKVVAVDYDGVTNTSVLVLRPKSRAYRSLLALCASDTGTVRWAETQSTGTKMPVINWGVFQSMPMPLPPEQLVKDFEMLAGPMLYEIGVLSASNQVLRRTRDLLLPRLLSGELNVEASAA